MVGYFAWNEEAAGSSPACYTRWAVMFQGWRRTFAVLLEGFDSITVHKIVEWCNGEHISL